MSEAKVRADDNKDSALKRFEKQSKKCATIIITALGLLFTLPLFAAAHILETFYLKLLLAGAGSILVLGFVWSIRLASRKKALLSETIEFFKEWVQANLNVTDVQPISDTSFVEALVRNFSSNFLDKYTCIFHGFQTLWAGYINTAHNCRFAFVQITHLITSTGHHSTDVGTVNTTFTGWVIERPAIDAWQGKYVSLRSLTENEWRKVWIILLLVAAIVGAIGGAAYLYQPKLLYPALLATIPIIFILFKTIDQWMPAHHLIGPMESKSHHLTPLMHSYINNLESDPDLTRLHAWSDGSMLFCALESRYAAIERVTDGADIRKFLSNDALSKALA